MSSPASVSHLPDLETLQDSPEGGANLDLRGAILAPTTVLQFFWVKYFELSEKNVKQQQIP